MPRTVSELLDHASQSFGDAPFLTVRDAGCSFAGFVAAVRATAQRLRQHGLQRGERVALLLPRDTHEAVALLACMDAGGIAVPIHSKLKDEQVRHVLEDAGARLVVSNAGRTVGLRDPEGVLQSFEVLDTEQWLECAAGTDVKAEARACRADAANPAVLLYTSGSTGRAKGIVQTHENLLLGARIVADFLELGPGDHLLALLSFSFDYGLNQLLSALLVGCRLTVAEHLGVGELAGLLRQHRPTGLAGVPSLWHEVATGLDSGALAADHGSSLRFVTNSGGALRPVDSSVMRTAWPHVNVVAMYGLTEAFRSAFLPPQEFDQYPDSFGYALEGVELVLVSTETGELLQGAATGELVHCGALVAAGYWQRPKEDARRFRPDPRPSEVGAGHGNTAKVAVYSGDLVRRDEAGRHFFVSRLDRMLKVHGHRVSPDEVAHAVASLPGVGEVAVFGIDGEADGHHIVMFVAHASSSAAELDDAGLVALVRRRFRAQLPSYMQPAIVRALRRLPHNQNGKVDYHALCAMLDECTDSI